MGSEKLHNPYPVLPKQWTLYSQNQVPRTFETIHFHKKFDKVERPINV